MKTLHLLLTAILLAVTSARAQLVNDGATNTLSNVTNTFAGDATVGTNGSFTLLVLSDNTLLTNSSNVVIGRNPTAKSNEVRLISSSARWLMGGLFAFPTLDVGGAGAFNRLVVSNGARIQAFFGNVGAQTSASNNLALVTGPGSVWSVATLSLGSSGAGNQLIVSNGGVMECASSTIGSFSGSSNNLAVVTGSGSVWTNQNNLTLGLFGVGNQLLVSEGGAVRDFHGIMGSDTAGSNNVALITGPGSVWSNASDLEIGAASVNNQMIVSNGAAVFAAGNGSIGSGTNANGNSVTVTDPGTSWLIASNLYVGSNGIFNRLVVSDNGSVVSSNGIVGENATAINNEAIVTGAGSTWSNRNELYVGKIAPRNHLVVSNGGTLFTQRDRFIGFNNSAISNTVIVTDAGSRWHGGSDSSLYVGSTGSFNGLVISNGGAMFNVRLAYIGQNTGANSNSVIVTGSGSVWTNNDFLFVGDSGSGNQLIVTNGGRIHAASLVIVGNNPSGSNSVALVTGENSLWQINGRLDVGRSSRANRLTVANGGEVSVAGGVYIGFNTPANQIFVTDTNSVFTSLSEFTVGMAGASNQFVISNGAVALAPGNLVLGGQFSSTNNRVVVDGGTLRVTNTSGTASLDVRRGTNVLNAGLIYADLLLMTNTLSRFEFQGGLLITRGAVINNGTTFTVGLSGSTPAIWDVRSGVSNTFVSGEIMIGSNASLNQLIHTNAALLTNSGGATLGRQFGANSNNATIAGIGSQWLLSGGLFVGSFGTANRLVVSNGATLVTSSSTVIGNEFLSTDNEAVITGPGTTWTSGPGQLFVGNGGRNNRLLVSDGAKVASFIGRIGDAFADTTNNIAMVTGAGSSWSNAADLYVGNVGARNFLVVSNGGTVFAGNAVYVGFASTSTGNLLIVDGGSLRVTNGANGLLEILRGTNILNAGLIEVDMLRLANGTQSQLRFNGGTVSARSSRFSLGNPLSVGNGVSPATFFLAGNGTHNFSGTPGLIVSSNATLAGNGTISGSGGPVTVSSGGTLSPGSSVGKIAFIEPLTLQGVVVMETSKNGSVLTNDVIQMSGGFPLNYGGSLIVSNLGPTALAAGDRFPLFSVTSQSGSFTAISLPPLGPGLSWTNKLLVDGSIEVIGVAQPVFGSITVSGTNVIVTGSNGTAGANYAILTTTNITLPSSNWVSIATNTFGVGGTFSFTNGIATGELQRYFRLRTP